VLRYQPHQSEDLNIAQVKQILDNKSNQIKNTKAIAWLRDVTEEDRAKAKVWDEAVKNVFNLLMKVEIEEKLEPEAADRYVFFQLVAAYHAKSVAGFAS
jgi:hypothetical protein